MIASIHWLQFALNFFLNIILIHEGCSQISELFCPFKGTIISLYTMASSCILISRLDHTLFYQHLLLVQSPYHQLLKCLRFSVYYVHFCPICHHQNKSKADVYHCMYVPRDILIPLESELSVHALCKRSRTNTTTHYFACSSPSTLVDNQCPLHHAACQLVNCQHQRMLHPF